MSENRAMTPAEFLRSIRQDFAPGEPKRFNVGGDGGRAMTKAEAFTHRSQLARALEEVARAVGESAPLYKAMGTVAWGRYVGEPAATDSKDNAVFGYGFLSGVRYALMMAARDNGWSGERMLSNCKG